MSKLPRYSLLILLLTLFSGYPALAEVTPPAKPVVDVDLGKTRLLLREWTQRKTFPDAITMANYYAYSFKQLDGRIKPKVQQRLVAFVKSCQRQDGGLSSEPKYHSSSNVMFTYYGLAALDLIGSQRAIDRDKAIGYLRGLIQDDGSVRFSTEPKGTASLASTFFAVESLRLLGKLELLDKDKVTAYVLTHRTSDQGFGVTTKGANSPRATSMAVRTLGTLGTLSPEVKQGAIRYLESAMALHGSMGANYFALSTTQAAEDIVSALVAMGVEKEVITEELVRFVLERYIPENGGFGPAPGLGTTPPSTYEALYCLATLGQLEQYKKPAAKKKKGK